MKKMILLLALVSLPAMAQHPQPPPPPDAPMPPEPPPPFFHGPPGIPPQVAARLGIPSETVKKVQSLSFDAQDALITLEADLKRAQLELERALAQPNPDESAVNLKLEAVAKAELNVRKNRIGLMLKIRKLVGPEMWDRLQAELPPMEMGGGHMRREVRVIRGPNGEKSTEVRESP